ncbi:inclusion body family protein [Azospirillum brasilense]|nr:inclusion body family protein [Azospirillum brasilense]
MIIAIAKIKDLENHMGARITNVLITFDTESILNDYKNLSRDPKNPTPISAKYIYMVTNGANAISGQAGGELNLKASVNDVIRWREATLTLSSDDSALMYAFVPTGGANLISPPQALLSTVTVPVPNPSNLTTPNFETIKDFFWNSIALDTGRVTYHFHFMITDRYGQVKGYCKWDPYITISN